MRCARMSTVRYFAYGSNMAPAIMAAWCARHRVLGPALLDGFRLAFLRRSLRWEAGAADVVEDGAAHVWGVLYQLEAADLAVLDAKEFTHRGGYRRRGVAVRPGGDGAAPVAAVTYE